MPRDINVPLSVILYFIDDKYRASHPHVLEDVSRVDLQRTLRLAKSNKVQYYFLKKALAECQYLNNEITLAILQDEETELARLRKTLEFISSTFQPEGIDFLVIKTFKGIPGITLDVDIAVKKKDLGNAVRTLKNSGAIITNGRFLNILIRLNLGFPGYQADELLKIDMYHGIPWPEMPAIDEDFLWENPRTADVGGWSCMIPSYEADLLSMISTTIYTDSTLCLLDFLYIISIIKSGPESRRLLHQVRKYGWESSLLRFLSSFQRMHETMYDCAYVPKDISFPAPIPYPVFLGAIAGPLFNKKRPKEFLVALANIGLHCFVGPAYGRLRRYLWV